MQSFLENLSKLLREEFAYTSIYLFYVTKYFIQVIRTLQHACFINFQDTSSNIKGPWAPLTLLFKQQHVSAELRSKSEKCADVSTRSTGYANHESLHRFQTIWMLKCTLCNGFFFLFKHKKGIKLGQRRKKSALTAPPKSASRSTTGRQ